MRVWPILLLATVGCSAERNLADVERLPEESQIIDQTAGADPAVSITDTVEAPPVAPQFLDGDRTLGMNMALAHLSQVSEAIGKPFSKPIENGDDFAFIDTGDTELYFFANGRAALKNSANFWATGKRKADVHIRFDDLVPIDTVTFGDRRLRVERDVVDVPESWDFDEAEQLFAFYRLMRERKFGE